jgi:hypothetical protein
MKVILSPFLVEIITSSKRMHHMPIHMTIMKPFEFMGSSQKIPSQKNISK